MHQILNHPRFWLFAPFIGLLSLTILAFGFWQFAAGRIVDNLAAQGLSWQNMERHGFPARITLDMQAPLYRRGDMVWQNTRSTATLMPFNRGHAVFDFFGTHQIKNDNGDISLAHQGNLMSVVAAENGLARLSFEAQEPRLTGTLAKQKIFATATKMNIHLRRQGTRMDAALGLKQLDLSRQEGALAQKFERFDVVSNLPQSWLTRAPQSDDRIKLERVTLQRGALTLVARGTLKLTSDGFMSGKMDVDFLNQKALLDSLQEFSFITAQQRPKFAFLFGLGAALGGDTQDRLSVPLILKNGRVLLGPLDIAAAPRWRD